MVCAQDDSKLRIIALLVDTPGYDQLMLPKSAAEQLAEKTELAKHLEEREKLLQEQIEEQASAAAQQGEHIQLHCAWWRICAGELVRQIVSERETKLHEQMEQMEAQARWLQEQNELVSERERKLQKQNELASERERELQEQMEEQRRELQEQVEELKQQLNEGKPLQ